MDNAVMDEEINLLSDDSIAKVKALLACMEAGDLKETQNHFEDLVEVRENEMYQEIGKLTRELHESINTFGQDESLVNIAEDEFPDARQRLAHVITMTDEAANTTLSSVEESLPLCEKVIGSTTDVESEWKRFSNRELTISEFKILSGNLQKYFTDNIEHASKINEHLTKVLMAQGFQDLTSQIIKRVISLVEEVEKSMIGIIQLSGGNVNDKVKAKDDDPGALDGPVVPGLETTGTVSGQDEVDDLLSSLGF